jgi:hypothetical protein
VILAPNDKLGYGQKKYYKKDHMVKNTPPETIVGWRVRLNQVWVPIDGVGIGENPAPEEESSGEEEAAGSAEQGAAAD